jgi:hypothetical protein
MIKDNLLDQFEQDLIRKHSERIDVDQVTGLVSLEDLVKIDTVVFRIFMLSQNRTQVSYNLQRHELIKTKQMTQYGHFVVNMLKKAQAKQ